MSDSGNTETRDEAQNVAAQGTVVASMTFISRITGFARDVVLSHFFGATPVADAFFVAFRIPNFFRRLFAEGAFNQAFVPVLVRYKESGGEPLRRFVAVMAGNLALSVCVLVLLGVVFAPLFTAVFAPGFIGSERYQLTSDLLQITFPYLLFVSLVAFSGAILNAHHRYAVPAITPVFLNLCLLVAASLGWLYAEEPVFVLAWGVFAAGLVQWLFQIPSLKRVGMLVAPRPSFRHEGARQVGRLLVPAVFAASVSQINALIDTILASMLVTGSVSWLYYSDRLLELPIGLVAVALGTVLLPNLSRLDARGQPEAFSATLDWGMSLGLMLGLPAGVALYVLADPLIGTIFFHGALGAYDVVMSSLALQAFAVGVLPMLLVKILAPAYFAREDTRTPFRIGVVAVAVNIVVNLSVFSWFGHVGLALATSISACVNAYLLLRGLMKSGSYQPGHRCITTLLQAGAAAGVMAATLIAFVPDLQWWLEVDLWTRIFALTGVVAGGGGLYLAALFAVGVRPRHLMHAA